MESVINEGLYNVGSGEEVTIKKLVGKRVHHCAMVITKTYANFIAKSV